MHKARHQNYMQRLGIKLMYRKVHIKVRHTVNNYKLFATKKTKKKIAQNKVTKKVPSIREKRSTV